MHLDDCLGRESRAGPGPGSVTVLVAAAQYAALEMGSVHSLIVSVIPGIRM